MGILEDDSSDFRKPICGHVWFMKQKMKNQRNWDQTDKNTIYLQFLIEGLVANLQLNVLFKFMDVLASESHLRPIVSVRKLLK